MDRQSSIYWDVSWETTRSPGVAVTATCGTHEAMMSVVDSLTQPGVEGVSKIVIEPRIRL